MPTEPKKTSTPTLISALRILASEVESNDGVANMTIAEGADRIEELCAELAALRRELETTCAELARRNLDDGELRQSHAKIYAAIGTQEADHTKWPEQIAALRRDKARLLDALDSVVSTLQDTDNSRADNSWKAERICNDVLSAMKGGRDE